KLAEAAEIAPPGPILPVVGNTVRLGTPAMASDFEVILNPGPASRLEAASAALDLLEPLENQMSVYRFHSELSLLDRPAVAGPVPVRRNLFELLQQAVQFSHETAGGFDPTSGPLTALWRHCKKERRLPSEKELCMARGRVGCQNIVFAPEAGTIRYTQSG